MRRLVLLVVALSGCVLPPSVDEVETPKNQPPRIDPTTLTAPIVEGPKFLSTLCPSYRFYATLSDPDVGDTLYWRVFLDYHRDEGRLFTKVSSLAPDPAALGEGRSITFNVNPLDSRLDYGDLTFLVPHTAELFVADRPFVDGPAPEGRRVEEDGLVASFVWPLQLGDTTDLGCLPEGG